MQLRAYQVRVVNEVGDGNKIVKMPTGSGKTHVAAECVRKALSKPTGEGKWALFLVPTVDLVEQQANVLREWCAELRTGVAHYRGTLAAPDVRTHRIVVSTPEAFRKLQMRDN